MQMELTKLKIEMLCDTDFTFFTTLLFSLDVHEDSTIETACTDGRFIKMNPNYWNSLVKDTRIGLLLHEVMHVALSHNTRLQNREPRKFNVACDYAINYDLIESGYKLPDGGLYDRQYAGMTAEQIYDLLPDSDNYDENDLVFNDDEQLKQDLDRLLMSAGAAAQMAGKAVGCIPNSAKRRMEEIKNPKLHWKSLFQDKMFSHSTDDYSMQFPDEEYAPELYVDTLYSEGMGDLSVYCDVSASVGQNDLDIILCEVNSCLVTLLPKKLTLVSFDTQIHLIREYSAHDLVDMSGINMKGGGGTSVNDVYQHIEKTKPEIALIITDGYYSEKLLNTSADVMYIILDNPNFTTENGSVIHISTKDY